MIGLGVVGVVVAVFGTVVGWIFVGDDLRRSRRHRHPGRAASDEFADVRVLALDTKNDLDMSVTMMRTLLVVGGATLLPGQVVPL